MIIYIEQVCEITSLHDFFLFLHLCLIYMFRSRTDFFILDEENQAE